MFLQRIWDQNLLISVARCKIKLHKYTRAMGIRVCYDTTGLPKDEFTIIDIAENKGRCEYLNRRDERNDFFVEKLFELGLVERNLRI